MAPELELGRAWWLALAGWLPVSAMLFLILIFAESQPHDLPVAVADAAGDSLSRQLIRSLDATPALSVERAVNSAQAGVQLLRDGEVDLLVLIPPGFSRDIALGKQPMVSAMINGQYLLTAKATRSALLQVEANFAATARVQRKVMKDGKLFEAIAEVIPLGIQASALYNVTLDYGRFLLPGLFAALYQALIACLAIFAWQVHSGAGKRAARTRAMLLLAGIFFAQGVFLFWLIWQRTETPPAAVMVQFTGLLVLFIAASQALGMLFVWLAGNTVRALSLVGAFSAPAFAFLGLTFPGSDMSAFAALWRELMPATHFAEAYIGVVIYTSAQASALPLLALLPGLAAWPLLLRHPQPPWRKSTPHKSKGPARADVPERTLHAD